MGDEARELKRETTMNENVTTVVLCGVGGQGTILAAELLASAAMEADLDVKVSEIHGMAQRGGSVVTVVRFGDEVHSMVCDDGCADCVIAFETTEALRALPKLAPDGMLIVNDEAIRPMSVLTGAASMPEGVTDRLLSAKAVIVPAQAIAREVGNAKTVNVVLLGAASALLPFDIDVWRRVVARRVPPKTIDANLLALDAGQSFLDEHRSA